MKFESDQDDNLIRECIAWNRKAQNVLYKKYASNMFAVCYRYSKSREEAEDTFHEGFMKVFENIKRFAHKGSLQGWIRKIMVNTALEKYRKNKKMSFVINMEDSTVYADYNCTGDILNQLELDELIKLIQKLPTAYKMVFSLYVLDGMKHREIATALGISVGTSKSNLYEAKSILQKQIIINNGKAESAENRHGRKQRFSNMFLFKWSFAPALS